MNTKEKIKIMQAFEDGETIEINIINENSWRELRQECEPSWNWSKVDYRIKPTHELLGCPFCGHEADKDYSFDNNHSIQCSNIDCDCFLDGFKDEKSAVEAWNRRT